jgi:ABC-type polysaccharide/polyol phosphate export permease
MLKQLKRLAGSRELLWNLTLRELRTKYRRSFLGWTWSLLNPLSLVLTYGFVFGVVFGAVAPIGNPSGLNNYALYLLSGLLPWAFFALVTNLGMGTLIGNGGLIKKVAFSPETLVFAQSIFSVVQFSIEIAVLIVIMLVISGFTLVPWIPVTILLMFLLAVFSTGIALALSVVAVYFRDLTYLWTIMLQVYFFATPIIYDPEVLKAQVSPTVLRLLEWNPMAVFIRAFRSTLYDAAAPEVSSLCFLAGISALSLVLGFIIFHSLTRRLAEEL